MIQVRLFRNKSKKICGFHIENHGSGIVCAAVSILALNTVNSIEKFTDDDFKCTHLASGGFIKFMHTKLAANEEAHDAELLLKSFSLGLHGIQDEYKNDIIIKTEGIKK